MTMQRSTLHFDLSHHSPDLEFRLLHGVKGGTMLKRYADAPSKLDEHRERNMALGRIPEEHIHRITHYLEDMTLPARGICLHQVVYPSLDDHPLPEIAALYFHIPTHEVLQALHRFPRYYERRIQHLSLTAYGARLEGDRETFAALHVDAADIKPPGVTAQTIVLQHPEIGSVDGAVAKYVLDTYVSDTTAFSELVRYIQDNGPGMPDQWYNKSWALWSQNADGTGPLVPAEADTELQFKGGKKAEWPTPTGGSTPSIPTYGLTDEYDPPKNGGGGDGVIGAAGSVVTEVLRFTKNDDALNGLLWTKQVGETEKSVQAVAPEPQVATGEEALLEVSAEAEESSKKKSKGFGVKNVTSSYGLYLYADQMNWDYDKKTLSFPVKNWPSRYLGAYVQFFKADGTPIKQSEIKASNPNDPSKPFTWEDRLGFLSFVKGIAEPSDTKNYLTWLSAGNAVFGVPTPFATQKTDLDFLWPDDATHAAVMLGGLGVARGFQDWDTDVDVVGVAGTGIVCYGIGALQLLATVYIVNPFIASLEGENAKAFYFLIGVLGVDALIIGIDNADNSTGKFILSKLAGFAASAAFSKGAARIADKILQRVIAEAAEETAAEITAEEALEQVPYVGWALKVASIASSIAALAATTIECLASPATYKLDVQHTMDLTVTVSPDPAHGKKGFKPVWPLVSDHYVIHVKYPGAGGKAGGTTYTKAGPMPGQHDQPITVVFQGIPAGGKIDVSGNIYSDTNWLCGRWDSGWINGNPDKDDQLATGGNIKELLVPLTATTRYSQKQTIAYSDAKKHFWEVSRFSIKAKLTVGLDKGGAPDAALLRAFDTNGNALSDKSSITVVTPLHHWTLTDPASSFDFDVAAHEIFAGPVFDLELSKIKAALDKGGATPSSIESAFSDAQYALPAGTVITVVTAGAKWTIAPAGQLSLYEIAADGTKAKISQTSWELTVQNESRPAPPLPTVYPLPTGPTGNELGALQNIIHNNKEYELGYAWMAAGQNLPLDDGERPENVPMYAMQSISTLGQPQEQIIQPTRGFSLPTLISYDQFGLTELFPLDTKYVATLKDGPVPADVAKDFADFNHKLPTSAQVSVITAGRAWQIGDSGKDPLYELRLLADACDKKETHIAVFSWPIPLMDNFYLDPRDHTTSNPVYYLRGIKLDQPPGEYEFDYDKSKAWGRILNKGTIQGLAVHPQGYVVAIDYTNHKLYALRLPENAMDSDKAPYAMPLSGAGIREGLMKNPQALTITADGRILILEEGNRRIQAFDVKGNPVACFSVNQPHFPISDSFVSDLDAHRAPIALTQAFQQNVTPSQAAKFGANSAASIATALDAGKVDALLLEDFVHYALAKKEDKTSDFEVLTTTPGKLWLVTNTKTQAVYDLRILADSLGIVHLYCFAAATLAVTVQAKGQTWQINDTTNAARYQITKPTSGDTLTVQQLISYMPLRDEAETGVRYLDIAVETKGFIYVLLVRQTTGKPEFLLDIYNPDGSVLLDKPQTGVNAAKLTVDQWRSLFTLNYNVVLGPNSRTEPGVSEWMPSTPTPAT